MEKAFLQGHQIMILLFVFLAIGMTAVILVQYDVVDPDELVIEKCSFSSELECVSYSLYRDVLEIEVQNTISKPIILYSIGVYNSSSTFRCVKEIQEDIVASKETYTTGLACDFASFLSADQKDKVELRIEYSTSKSGRDFARVSNGRIVAKMINETKLS